VTKIQDFEFKMADNAILVNIGFVHKWAADCDFHEILYEEDAVSESNVGRM